MRATGYAVNVGRVGALAVALGIGVALVNNGVAWADDNGPTGAGGNTGTARATDTGRTSGPDGTSTTANTPKQDEKKPSGVDNGAVNGTKVADSPTNETPTKTEPPTGVTTESGADSPSDEPLDNQVSAEQPTGEETEPEPGADPPSDETPPANQVTPEQPTGEVTEPEPVAEPIVTDPERPAAETPAGNRRGGSNKRNLQFNDPADGLASVANAVTRAENGPRLPAEISDPPQAGLADEPQPVAASTVTNPSPSPTIPVKTPTSSTVTQQPQPQLSGGSEVMLGLLGGLDPSGTDDSPVDSPLGLALLAAGSRLRQFEQELVALVGGQQAVLAGTLTSTGQTPSEAALVAEPEPYATQTGSKPAGVVVSSDGTRVYTANTGSNTVSVINNEPESSDYQKVIKTVSVGFSPAALALNADGTRLYVANTGSNTVSVISIDTATDTYERIDANPSIFSRDIGTGGWSPSALALSSDGTRLYVANRASNTVSVIDTETNKLIDANPSIFSRTIGVGGYSPSALALSSDGTRLYVANSASNTVSVIDTETDKLIDANPSIWSKTIAVGGYSPSALALNPDGTRLYVANSASNTVSVIDTDPDTGTFNLVDTDPVVAGTQSLFVGSAPTSLAVSADGERVYVALSSDMLAVINTGTNVVSLAAMDATPESGAHSLALGPDGAVYVTDSADGTLRALSLVEGTVTIGRSTLELPTGNGTRVQATWYFPNHDDPPVGLIYLQHGWNRTDVNVSALAQQLAEQTNSIVVTPTLSSNGADRYYMSNDVTEQAVAALFLGDRTALTASAAAAAGDPVMLPDQYVLAGHSLGGSVVTAAAGRLAMVDETEDLKAVILFDRNGDDFGATFLLAELTGANAVPVFSISAPPCACNGFGFGTSFTVNAAPDNFVGVLLDNGTHLDAEGAATDSLGMVGCWQGPPGPSNTAAVQTLSTDWINDVFTGSRTGVYDATGTTISVGDSTGRVLKNQGLTSIL